MTGQGKARPRASDETWWGRTYKLPKAYKGMQDRNTQTHGQVSAALLTDSPQACSPFGGLSRPRCPSLPLARSLLLPTVDLLRSAFGPEKVSVHPLDPNWDPGPIPLCPPCLLATCSFHAWPWRGFPAMDVVLAVLQSPDIPPALLEETTKTKQEPALFRGECFHPVSAS